MNKLEDLTFYELLSLEPEADLTEIEHAFDLAMQTYGADSMAVYSVLSEEERERLISRIRQAYAVLVDQGRRDRYDERLRLTGDATRAALETASESKEEAARESVHSIWAKFRQALPTHATRGVKVSKILGPRKPTSELSISSGQYLESVRKLKGISLEEISERTKIKIRYLEALEREDYTSLPGGAYQRYILKALAQAIDLDAEAVVADFQRRTCH